MSPLPAELILLLRTQTVKLYQRAVFGQIVFSTSQSHAGNSQINFWPSSDASVDIQVGVIVYV